MNDTLPRERISPIMGWMIIGYAAALDTLKFAFEIDFFIPIIGLGPELVGDAISIFADISLGFWLWILLRPQVSLLRFSSLAGSGIMDMIPVANIMFWNTAATWYIVHKTQKEDKKNIAAAREAARVASEAA